MAVVLCIVLLASAAPGRGADGEGLRLLFIGNSLTYANDLPGMLERMLKEAGIGVETVDALVQPNFGLPDHWRRRETKRRIALGWHVVVVQQGPSATEGRPYLLEYSRRFAKAIRKAGGRPALYMVWPAAARSLDFDGVVDSYATAAEQVDGLLFPVGQAWRAAWRRDPDLPLYGPDHFHPSVLGTYLAALVMFEQLSGRELRDLPPEIPTSDGVVELPPELARLLREAAAEANAALARR